VDCAFLQGSGATGGTTEVAARCGLSRSCAWRCATEPPHSTAATLEDVRWVGGSARRLLLADAAVAAFRGEVLVVELDVSPAESPDGDALLRFFPAGRPRCCCCRCCSFRLLLTSAAAELLVFEPVDVKPSSDGCRCVDSGLVFGRVLFDCRSRLFSFLAVFDVPSLFSVG